MGVTLSSERREAVEQRARVLEYTTTAWNVVEAIVAISTGIAAGSLGLVAFGLDSCVEVFASIVVLWHLRGHHDDGARSRRAMRLIAGAFALLAAYLGFQAARTLVGGAEPSRTWVGLVFLAATVVVMVLLAWGKRRAGHELGNEPLITNATMTLLDGGLAAATLVAVFVAVEFGWWWADAAAAGVVAIVAAREAITTWRGE